MPLICLAYSSLQLGYVLMRHSLVQKQIGTMNSPPPKRPHSWIKNSLNIMIACTLQPYYPRGIHSRTPPPIHGSMKSAPLPVWWANQKRLSEASGRLPEIRGGLHGSHRLHNESNPWVPVLQHPRMLGCPVQTTGNVLTIGLHMRWFMQPVVNHCPPSQAPRARENCASVLPNSRS